MFIAGYKFPLIYEIKEQIFILPFTEEKKQLTKIR